MSDRDSYSDWLAGAATLAGRYVQTACADRRRCLVPKERSCIAEAMEQVNPLSGNRLLCISNSSGIFRNDRIQLFHIQHSIHSVSKPRIASRRAHM
jgi:hypothetical protein